MAGDEAEALADRHRLPAISCGKGRTAHNSENCHGEGNGQWKGTAERAPEISKGYTTAERRLVAIGLNVKANERNDVALYLPF